MTTKLPKKPRSPYKPSKPKKPNETLSFIDNINIQGLLESFYHNVYCDHCDCFSDHQTYHCLTMDQLNKVKEFVDNNEVLKTKNIEDIKIDFMDALVYFPNEKKNELYERQLEKYEKDLKKHTKELKKYNEDYVIYCDELKKYNEQLEVYEAEQSVKKYEKLKKELASLEKKVKNNK